MKLLELTPTGLCNLGIHTAVTSKLRQKGKITRGLNRGHTLFPKPEILQQFLSKICFCCHPFDLVKLQKMSLLSSEFWLIMSREDRGKKEEEKERVAVSCIYYMGEDYFHCWVKC